MCTTPQETERTGGNNEYGQLGLGHNTDQNELTKIPNIPPIKILSCVS